MKMRALIAGALLVGATLTAAPVVAQPLPEPCAPEGSPLYDVAPRCDDPVPDDYVIEILNPADPDGTSLAGYYTDDPAEGEALCQLAEQDGNPYTRCTRG